MDLTTLSAISPVDGRYRNQVRELAPYMSEFGLIRFRVHVEVEYFIALCELPLPQLKDFDKIRFPELRKIVGSFTTEDALKIKETEKTTNHDVKAVEYFLKARFDELGIGKYREFIHFGLTSQDINNTATPASLKAACTELVFPAVESLISTLDEMAEAWKNIPMLARTHGQPASPTRLGKEIKVFAERLRIQLAQARQIPWSAKFGGATGNFNAHSVAYPQINWPKFADLFVNERLGLSRSGITTQIEHYDNMAAFCDASKRINTIIIDLCRDIWTYISLEYFKQKIKEGEIGSSAMPHKVNPIDFENAEGNLGMANAIFSHLSEKLPISRMQRDLTDSTVLRNLGVPLAHTLIALKSVQKGLGKLLLNEKALVEDLNSNWAVVAEGIQTILRREGYPGAYEALLELTRKNKPIDEHTIREFIGRLTLDEKVKAELMAVTPLTYTGINLF
ncbi:MAG: adenylosuccinate lyase [Bacteroidales bacterium]